ncbi:HGGxSTG domain-containing protein [Pantoea dispersa]|uniref:HGGxSTG domain-containing protein n=1 Tax=Pantoea dispersa TaxID=59814 RepID=UPI0023A93C2A|nr:HGGxSTG domain-containing protein [Pantoea dispersa]WEA07788.1 HGGxSTG domain-containing protein [Pantoea dispersa]
MPEELRHISCAAKTRAGTPCKRTDINSNGRCKYHGGHSTGAITKEGKARQLEGTGAGKGTEKSGISFGRLAPSIFVLNRYHLFS